MKYHYFIGIQLPQNLQEQIKTVQMELFDSTQSPQPLEPHITLLPPPSVENIDPNNLKLHVKAAAQPNLPFEIKLTDVITFQNRAVVLRAESKTIFELQKQLVELLPFEADVAYFPEREFTPHVTLVQSLSEDKQLPAALLHAYQEAAKALIPTSFKVESLTLFKQQGPRRYQAEVI